MRRVLVVALVAALAGCGNPAPNLDARGEITVFADTSLTEAFTAMGRVYEALHPGTEIVFNFLGSSTLVQQINQGAPADVFASASAETMEQVRDAISPDHTADTTIFARNQLVIAVPEGNPEGVAGLSDLTRPRLKVAVCAEPDPCGLAARGALAAARVRPTLATEERDSKAALTKLRKGEVDAALVYRTDQVASSDVDAVEFPESAAEMNDYLIAVLENGRNPELARAFLAFVISDRRELINKGFPMHP